MVDITSIFLFSLFLSISLSDHQWKNYTNYACNTISSAYNIEYEISITQCYDSCINDSNCKGVTWYQYLKVDVNNDPTRCYLLNKICDLTEVNAIPVITSFWYNDIKQQTQCINYPYDWTDEFFDNCPYYESLNICDNSYSNPSKQFILDSTDYFKYNYNAFETCCNCTGSLYEYETTNTNGNTLLIEPLWKSSSVNNIIDHMICQSYSNSNPSITSNIIQSKWNFNQFISICQHFRNKVYYKYDIIQSISNTTTNNPSVLSKFDCIDNNILTAVNNTYYLCDEFDHNAYPFVIQLSPDNNNIYLNSYFIDSADFHQNFRASNNIISQSKCNVIPLTQSNSINIFTALICDYYETPTNYPTMNPTLSPFTGNVPTTHPLINPTISPSFNPSTAPIIPIPPPTKTPSEAPVSYASYPYECYEWTQERICPTVYDSTELKMKCECGNELEDGYHYKYDENDLSDYPCKSGCSCCRTLIDSSLVALYPTYAPVIEDEPPEDKNESSDDDGSPWTILIVLVTLGVVILLCVFGWFTGCCGCCSRRERGSYSEEIGYGLSGE